MNTINVNLIPKLWVSKVNVEGQKASWFNKLMAKDGSMPIHKNTDLVGKKGLSVTFPLKMNLTGAGVTGNTTLLGAEEALVVNDFTITVDQTRQAVSSTSWDSQKPVYDQWPEIKDSLTTWFANWQDNTLITKLTASPTGTSTSGEWMSAAAAGTEVAITASDKLTVALIGKVKRRALKHSPKVEPFNVPGYGEYYALLVSTEAARDLRTDQAWIDAQNGAGVRDALKNPQFSGALGLIDGVAVFEYERISVTATGASSALVSHNLLLGKQAACYAIAKEMFPIKQETDYGNVLGQGIAFWNAIAKTIYNSKDFGIIQLLTGGAAD